MRLSFPVRLAILVAAAAIPVIVVLSLAPIAQPEAYHSFADARTWFGVPHFQNVVSNAPFLFVGIAGLAALRRTSEARRAWSVFFAAVICVAPGSAWYHLDPTTPHLFWDRLPMAVAFGSFTAALIEERVHGPAGRALFVPLVLGAAASVVAWRISEERGRGDVRTYVLAQTLTLIATVVVVVLFPRGPREDRLLGALAAWYGAAKLLEHFDAEIYRATGQVVSGHAVKHLAAAAGVWHVVRLIRRRAITTTSADVPADTAPAIARR